jgi:hypothetical protein
MQDQTCKTENFKSISMNSNQYHFLFTRPWLNHFLQAAENLSVKSLSLKTPFILSTSAQISREYNESKHSSPKLHQQKLFYLHGGTLDGNMPGQNETFMEHFHQKASREDSTLEKQK